MDSHRLRQCHGRRPNSAQISGTNFKTTVAIGLGIVTLFAGIILIVAFGLPSDISQNPRSISGVVVCVVGVCLSFIASVYAYTQNVKRKKRIARSRLMKVRTLAQVAPVFKHSSFSRKTSAQASSSPTQISLTRVDSLSMSDESSSKSCPFRDEGAEEQDNYHHHHRHHHHRRHHYHQQQRY